MFTMAWCWQRSHLLIHPPTHPPDGTEAAGALPGAGGPASRSSRRSIALAGAVGVVEVTTVSAPVSLGEPRDPLVVLCCFGRGGGVV